MENFSQTIGFEFPRLLWQLVNFAVLLGFLGAGIFLPIWIFKKVNSVEKNLKEINEKLDRKD